MAHRQAVLSIKVKRQERKSLHYLTVDRIKLLLEQIPTGNCMGRRNLALYAYPFELIHQAGFSL